jgi:hypothetical protein
MYGNPSLTHSALITADMILLCTKESVPYSLFSSVFSCWFGATAGGQMGGRWGWVKITEVKSSHVLHMGLEFRRHQYELS